MTEGEKEEKRMRKERKRGKCRSRGAMSQHGHRIHQTWHRVQGRDLWVDLAAIVNPSLKTRPLTPFLWRDQINQEFWPWVRYFWINNGFTTCWGIMDSQECNKWLANAHIFILWFQCKIQLRADCFQLSSNYYCSLKFRYGNYHLTTSQLK